MEDRNLDIGYVFGKTFSVIGERFSELAILAVILVGAPSLLLALVSAQMVEESIASGGIPQFSLGFILVNIISWLLPLLLQAAVVHTTVQSMTGRPADFRSSLSVAFGVLLPLIGLTILMSLGLMIGFMLLIVPGLILLTLWVVAVPAFVVEGTGVIGAFGRSMELTENQRWRIFGLLVLAWLAMLVVSVILAGIGMAGYVGAATYDGTYTGMSLFGMLFNAIVSMAAGVVGAVGVSVLYLHLRDLKEGAAPETIGDVFR